MNVGPQRYDSYERIDPENHPLFSLTVRYETRNVLELLGVFGESPTEARLTSLVDRRR